MSKTGVKHRGIEYRFRRLSIRVRMWILFGLVVGAWLLAISTFYVERFGFRFFTAVTLMTALDVAALLIFRSVIRSIDSVKGLLKAVNVGDDLSVGFPQSASQLPEAVALLRNARQLMERLKGFRALNVRRLLIEKRRADIIAASISDGIFLLRDNQILYMNPVAEKILGRSDLPAGGSDIRVLANAPVQGDSAGEQSQTQRCARAIMCSQVQTMPVELVFEAADRTSYYLFQSHPISFGLIEQIEHDADASVGRVLDRFQADTLVVAQDVTIVRESQEAKRHFIGTLSHEVKTPVTSLMMAIRLLNKSIDDFSSPIHQALIKTCVQDVERLRRLLDDLLNASNFDVLDQRLQFQTFDLFKFIKRALESVSGDAKDREIFMAFKVLDTRGEAKRGPEGAFPIAFDPTKLAWAFRILLTNAIRHSPRGGSVETTIVCAGEEWVEVRVRDHGPGIERKRHARIFDKFAPFYDIQVARSDSTGVGLSVAREIIVAHGGRIWVSSELGKGAEFCFTLPLRQRSTNALTRARSGDISDTTARMGR
ncbi:MAG: ATP-binding protein [Oligoflexia bacterium]|nr:ATP-binding protein [Oligoflexia bacterium]